MAQNKPSGFRFRLPWLLQPALATPPATATETPRTTGQTSVASTSAPKPPFRPPGRAPPRAQPQPASSPVSVAPPPSPPPPPPPPPVEAKLPVPKSPIAKTIDPVKTRSTKETQTVIAPTIATTGPATPPPRPPSFRPVSPPQPSSPEKVDSQPSSPIRTGTKLRDSSPPVSPTRMPTSPRADFKPSSPSRLATQSQPSSPAKQDSQPSSPPRTETKFRDSTPPVSPSRISTPPGTDSKPLPPPPSPTPPYFTNSPSSPSGKATPSRPASQPTSPVHVQPPPPPAPTMNTSAVEEVPVNHVVRPTWLTSNADNTQDIKTSTEITHEKFPVNAYHVPHGADLATDVKPKENSEVKGAQTKSVNPHSMEVNSSKPEQKVATHVPLHKEIKDDISKFIHKMATSPPKQSMDEKPASIITLAGENKGAIMHLGSDANKRVGGIDIQRGYKLDAIINGEGSSNGEKSKRDSKASEDEETKAIVNSNIQGINNSIMLNSSVTERNPGVHLAFHGTLANTDSKIENTEPMEMYKAEVDITPPDTLVYDPTLGTSLGGFILEPSDSEPDSVEIVAENYEIEVL